jgi:hypothetical protein
VVSLFAVTHQGPAQGGKAGGSKLPGDKYSKEKETSQVIFTENTQNITFFAKQLHAHAQQICEIQAQFSP